MIELLDGDRVDWVTFVTADGYRLTWDGKTWGDGDLTFLGTAGSGPLGSTFRWRFEGTENGACGDGCHRCSGCRSIWSEGGDLEVEKGSADECNGAHDCTRCSARCEGLKHGRLWGTDVNLWAYVRAGETRRNRWGAQHYTGILGLLGGLRDCGNELYPDEENSQELSTAHNPLLREWLDRYVDPETVSAQVHPNELPVWNAQRYLWAAGTAEGSYTRGFDPDPDWATCTEEETRAHMVRWAEDRRRQEHGLRRALDFHHAIGWPTWPKEQE